MRTRVRSPERRDQEALDRFLDYFMPDDQNPVTGRRGRRHVTSPTSSRRRRERDFSPESARDFSPERGGVLSELLGGIASTFISTNAPRGSTGGTNGANRKNPGSPSNYADSLDGHHRRTRHAGPRISPNQRKPSGIIRMRSYAANDRGNDNTSFRRTNLRGETISEDDQEEFSTYSRENVVIRVRSKDSRVSELTEIVPGRGMRRKSSGRSEKALAGGTLQAQKSASLSKRSDASMSNPPLTPTSWNLRGEQLYTIDDGIDDYDEDKICDNTASFRDPPNNVGSLVTGESMDPSTTPTTPRNNVQGNTSAYAIHVHHMETSSAAFQDNMSVSKRSIENHHISDKASQKTSSSASTQRRGNHIVVNARGDASASLSSGLTSADLNQPSPSPRKKGLLACSRGNKLERLAARKEELAHIMVFDPSPRPNLTQTFTFESPKSAAVQAPSPKLPNRVSSTLSRKGTPRPVSIQVHEPSTDKPALLLGSRNSTVKQNVAIATHSQTIPAPSTTTTNPHILSGKSMARNGSQNRPHFLNATMSEDDFPNPHPQAYAAQQNKTVPPVKTNLTSPRWPIPGILTSELDQLAPLGKSPKKQTRTPKKKPYRPVKTTWKAAPASPPSSPPRVSQVFSDHETAYTEREESTYVTGFTSNPSAFPRRGPTVYDRKRVASRLTFPTFHWQSDDASIGVMSLDYE